MWYKASRSFLWYSVTYGVLRIHALSPEYCRHECAKKIAKDDRRKEFVSVYYRNMFKWLSEQHQFSTEVMDVEYLFGRENTDDDSGFLGARITASSTHKR